MSYLVPLQDTRNSVLPFIEQSMVSQGVVTSGIHERCRDVAAPPVFETENKDDACSYSNVPLLTCQSAPCSVAKVQLFNVDDIPTLTQIRMPCKLKFLPESGRPLYSTVRPNWHRLGVHFETATFSPPSFVET